MKKNNNGFIGLTLLILFVIGAAGFYVVSQIGKPAPKRAVSTQANGFIDNPECAAFNNYVNDHVSLPADLTLKMRAYIKCGNFFAFENEPQSLVLGYQSDKHFTDANTLYDYLNSALIKTGWKNVSQQNDSTNYAIDKIGATLKIIAFNPATIELKVTGSSTDYKTYSTVKKSSPPQKLLSKAEQLKAAPFKVYIPTVFPYLATAPQNLPKDITISNENYLSIDYYANGLLISYYSIQAQKAESMCKLGPTSECAVWATALNGSKIYANSYYLDKNSLKDMTSVYVTIDDTTLEIRGLDTNVTKDNLIQIVDSLKKVN